MTVRSSAGVPDVRVVRQVEPRLHRAHVPGRNRGRCLWRSSSAALLSRARAQDGAGAADVAGGRAGRFGEGSAGHRALPRPWCPPRPGRPAGRRSPRAGLSAFDKPEEGESFTEVVPPPARRCVRGRLRCAGDLGVQPRAGRDDSLGRSRASQGQNLCTRGCLRLRATPESRRYRTGPGPPSGPGPGGPAAEPATRRCS